MSGRVQAVSCSPTHTFAKSNQGSIRPLTGRGVEGDAHLGETAVVAVTGLRNPCLQLDRFQPGLMAAVLSRDEHGALIRKAGVMAIVMADGEVRPGDLILVELPPAPHRSLEPV